MSVRHLRGVIPVIVTPFAADESIDFDALAREIEFLCAGPCDWLSIGFGSEVSRLSPAELDALVSFVVEISAGRIGVIGNAEITGVQAGIAALERAAGCGPDLAMVRPSALEGVGQHELFDTIAAVAQASSIPFIVQDAPQSTFVVLEPDTLADLIADVDGVAAAKVEPLVSVPKIVAVVAALHGRDGVVLGGLGGRNYVEELSAGAQGTMPGPAFPELLAAVQLRVARGDIAGAYQLLAQMLPLANLGSRDMDVFRYLQKYVLKRRGVLPHARLRRPHGPIGAGLDREIDQIVDGLDFLGLLESCATEFTAAGDDA